MCMWIKEEGGKGNVYVCERERWGGGDKGGKRDSVDQSVCEVKRRQVQEEVQV